jgi:glutaconate CoA-transferase, subunit A
LWAYRSLTEILTPDAAVRGIRDGACVGVGGSVNTGHPMALVRALIRSGARDLTIAGLTSGLDLDLLVAAGAVSRLSAAYVGAEDIVGLPPAIRWAAEEGRLDVWECEEGVHLASLRARCLRQPYATWPGGVGTSVVDHPLVEQAVDEATGRAYLKVRPLEVDVALVWAEAADENGNLLLFGPDLGDPDLLNAADVRIVQVERVVPTRVLTRHPDRVVPWSADVIVPAPLSTHPFSSTSLRVDDEWLLLYAGAVTKARKDDDPAALEAFIDDWIRSPGDEDAYFEKVGFARVRELMT